MKSDDNPEHLTISVADTFGEAHITSFDPQYLPQVLHFLNGGTDKPTIEEARIALGLDKPRRKGIYCPTAEVIT